MNDEAQMVDETYINDKGKQYQLKTTKCNETQEYNTDTTHSNLTREGNIYAMKQVRKSSSEVKMHAVDTNNLATNTTNPTNPHNNTNNQTNQTAINTSTQINNQYKNPIQKQSLKKNIYNRPTKANHHVNIMTINVRGIRSKLDSLESYLKANEIHIAGITETHLQGKENIYIDGYRWIGKNRNKDGGGVGFCIKDTLIPAVNNEINNDEKEILWITFKAKETIKIGVYYGKQENYNREKIIKEYEEITEEANDIKPKEHIIIMGDFNAKLKVQRDDCNQIQSRNGTLLKNMMKQTNTMAINTLPQHKGTWSRINTKNTRQKSIIDYIIISKKMQHMISESETDSDGNQQITGKQPTDHRTITMKLDMEIKMQKKIIKRWKPGKPEQWAEYNSHLQNSVEKDGAINITKLTKIIVTALTKSIGRATITTGRERKCNSVEVKEAKQYKKLMRKQFNEACKGKNVNKINEVKAKYIESQKIHRKEIENAMRVNTNETLQKLITNGNIDMNEFWKVRKQIMNKTREDYDIIDENNLYVKDPEKAKTHVADYFEDLYQAREESNGYEV